MAKKAVTAVTPTPEQVADMGIVTVPTASQDADNGVGHVAETKAEAAGAPPAGLIETTTKTKTNADGAVADPSKIQRETGFSMEKMMKSAEDFVSFSQGNVEAFMKSGQIWATGVQDMSKALAATAQAQVDAAVATMKALSSVKSLKDAVDLQTTLARSSVETVIAETGKLTDASMKLAEQALAPITARVTLATEKFSRTA
jgi:phasin family protein